MDADTQARNHLSPRGLVGFSFLPLCPKEAIFESYRQVLAGMVVSLLVLQTRRSEPEKIGFELCRREKAV